jgi:2,4-dienoyl-CoA reductase-like NADH-dependent reductase (Old Yellow Enzyme family)
MNELQIGLPLTLPCGAIIKNRLAKSAMSENMATDNHHSTLQFERLYDRWAMGGSGLVITGNVMIDPQSLGEPQNVVIGLNFNGTDDLKRWAAAGTKNNTHLWIQLNHPGKQSPNFLSKVPVAPSAIPFESSLSRLFNPPRALLENEIFNIIERFAHAAKVARDAGFTGVQIHGAHGYLISQFLSPRHNTRQDQWGGSLENRMRFVLLIYQAIRIAVGEKFPIGIKLNSADFQKGGFSEEDSLVVAKTLSEAGMDLIEISGGTYESPKMMGTKKSHIKESTIVREAYFLEFCEKVRSMVKTPLMLTGGFRTLEGMEQTLISKSCDLIGLARSVALNPDFPNLLLSGKNIESEVAPLTSGIKALDNLLPLEIIWYTQQIHRMGKGFNPSPKASVLGSILSNVVAIGLHSLTRVRSK